MKRAASIALVVSLGACGSGTSETTPPLAPNGALLGAGALRCVLRDPVLAPATGARETAPWIVRGPTGPRLVTQLHRYVEAVESVALYMVDGADPIERPLPAGLPGSLAWTGGHYLALLPNGITRFDAGLREGAPVRGAALPPASCGATLAEGSDRVLALWGRPARGSECYESKPWVQAFDASGAPIGDPVALPPPEGVDRVAARWTRARWDFGRFVVTAELADTGVWSWVLDPDGRVLGSARDVVACPRSGCVRVSATLDSTGDDVDTTAQVIRVSPAARGGAPPFSTSASAREVRGVVVSGDRILVLHDTPSRAGCGLAVIDVGRRATVTQLTEDALECAEAHARPRARGFAFAFLDPARGAATRAIDCLE